LKYQLLNWYDQNHWWPKILIVTRGCSSFSDRYSRNIAGKSNNNTIKVGKKAQQNRVENYDWILN
jgi:hypothetical protein